MSRVGRRARLRTALTWPAGVPKAAWDYFWRITPLHRTEVAGARDEDAPPPLPAHIEQTDLQQQDGGVGPLFHRRYQVRIRGATLSPEELVRELAADLNTAAPTGFARFVKVRGPAGRIALGDEYVVRLPGPWDGPVRVVACGPTHFRLATLDGHMEAGQIEFRASAGDLLEFEIESWARSGDQVANLLYAHARLAKEMQLHMWISFIERVVTISGGRTTGGIRIDTRWLDEDADDGDVPRGSPRIQRTLTALRTAPLNFEPDDGKLSTGWRRDNLCQELPAEAPGPPLVSGSFAAAKRLMEGYQFADPSIVRAYYDPDEPLEGRTMLLEVRFHGLRFLIGVRVSEVYERTIQHDDRTVQVWGWSYATLAGHFEMGQMDWQLWKFVDSGEVQFRIQACSRRAPVANLLVRVGFRIFGRREQLAFLHSTLRRMAVLTALAVERGATEQKLREASAALTARDADTTAADDELARRAASLPGRA